MSTLRAEGCRIACLELVRESVSLADFRVEPGVAYALVVGHEVEGIDPAIVDGADLCIEIPQYGTKHSLNVAVSTAIALWEFAKQMNTL